MDVSSLLNAAPAEIDVREERRRSSQASPKRSSSSTPTPATGRCAEGYSGPVGGAERDSDNQSLPHRPGTRVPPSDSYWQGLRGAQPMASQRSIPLEGCQRSDGHDGGYTHRMLPDSRVHRFSDSQSSISSYESTPSQPHSRTSSVTTVGDDNAASVPYVDSFDDTKLATVLEETSLRAQTKKDGYRRASRTPRPPLMINTDASNAGNVGRRRHSKTMSNIKGARSSGRLPGCTLLPPARRSSTSQAPGRDGSSQHLRTFSAPEDRTGSGKHQNRHTTLNEFHPPTMSQVHSRQVSTDSLSGTPIYLSRPNSPFAMETAPHDAPHEPDTPHSSCSLLQVSTPQSVTSVSTESPFVNSASTSDAVVGRYVSILGTPTRPSRTRSDTQVSTASDVDLDQPCYAQEGCMENSVSRKAISHFFGRNKKCTMLIPSHVWISICRKHYQRTRYRNQDRYAMYQIDLVVKQIDKVAIWELTFTSQGKASPIKSWTVALRKRQTANAVAMPEWILLAAGSGWTTAQVRDMALRIQDELERKLYKDIPEIEFLPDITSSVAKSPTRRETKKHVRRVSSISSGFKADHSRSSSMSANVDVAEPSAPLEGINNPYYQPVRRHAQWVAEKAEEDLKYFHAEHKAAMESRQPPSRLSRDGYDYTYCGLPVPANSMPPPDTVPQQRDAGQYHAPSQPASFGESLYSYGSSNPVLPRDAGQYQSQSEHGPFGDPYYPYGNSGSHLSSSTQASRVQAFLPSFSSGFGSAWNTRIKEEPCDFDGRQSSVSSVYPLHSTPSQHGAPALHGAPAPTYGREYYTSNAGVEYMSTSGQRGIPTTQPALDYASPFGAWSMPLEHRPAPVHDAGAAQYSHQMNSAVSEPEAVPAQIFRRSGSGAQAPQADMDGRPAAEK